MCNYIWVRSGNCGCLVTWFCYQLIAKPCNKTDAVSWPEPFVLVTYIFFTVTINTHNHGYGTLLQTLCIFNSFPPWTKWPPFHRWHFQMHFHNGNVWILFKIPLKFVPKVWIDNIPALVQIMAWHQPSNNPLLEPMMASLLTHICVTWPQWVKHGWLGSIGPQRAYVMADMWCFLRPFPVMTNRRTITLPPLL